MRDSVAGAVARGLIGTPVRRSEDPRLLTGSGVFVDDVRAPGALHAVFVRSTRAHAELVKVDVDGALARPGVVAAYTAATLPCPLPTVPDSALSGQGIGSPYVRSFFSPPQPLLAVGRVHYVGQPVAIVLGRDRYATADAAEAVSIQYADLPVVTSIEQALRADAAVLHDKAARNVAGHLVVTVGDVERAFAEAAVTVSERLIVQRVFALPLETRGVLALGDGRSRSLTVHIANQNPYRFRDSVAGCLGLSPEDVRVIAQDVGGGFGGKGMVYPEELLCSVLAFHLGVGVRWTETRVESFLSTNHARQAVLEGRLAARSDGTIVGLDVTIHQDCGAFCHYEMILPTVIVTHLSGPYRVPNFRAEAFAVLTNKVQASPYRGAGRPEAVFVIERLLDRLSRELDRDPADVRRHNLVVPSEIPYRTGLTNINGTPVEYDSGDFPGMLERALVLAEYDRRRAEQRAGRATGRLLGLGIASCVEGGGMGPCEGATIRVDSAGRVNVFLGVGSQGQSHETVFAQVCADILGARLDDVKVRGGDTTMFPNGFGTRASRVAVNSGNAVARTAETVRRRACEVAARLLECGVDDVDVKHSRLHVRGMPDRGVSLADVAQAALSGPSAPGGPGLTATEYFYPPTPTWAASVHVAVVEIDPETGQLCVLRYVLIHDSGRALNEHVVEGQAVGGIAQGLGATIGECLVYDDTGQLITGSLMDYAVVRAEDMPPLCVEPMDFPARSNPLGVKGISEGSVAGPPSAIANAVEDAFEGRVRVTSTPITTAQLWRWASLAGPEP